jgi:allantoin racemase
MRIEVINPTTSTAADADSLQALLSYAFQGTQVNVSSIEHGPASIESELDEALCLQDFLRKAKQAEAEGYDAVISNCFADPGVKAAREILSIPVVGAGEASMHFAASLGQRFSIISVLPNAISMIENLVSQYGLESKLASVRCVNIPVLRVREKESDLVGALHREMLAAITEDHAHVLILGCTDMFGIAKEMESRLKKEGYEVPVIDPLIASLKHAEALVSMKLRQSRLTYMPPPEKARGEMMHDREDIIL